MKPHRLLNQNNKIIGCQPEKNIILTELDRGKDSFLVEGKLVSVVSDYRCDEYRETILKIEGI